MIFSSRSLVLASSSRSCFLVSSSSDPAVGAPSSSHLSRSAFDYKEKHKEVDIVQCTTETITKIVMYPIMQCTRLDHPISNVTNGNLFGFDWTGKDSNWPNHIFIQKHSLKTQTVSQNGIYLSKFPRQRQKRYQSKPCIRTRVKHAPRDVQFSFLHRLAIS